MVALPVVAAVVWSLLLGWTVRLEGLTVVAAAPVSWAAAAVVAAVLPETAVWTTAWTQTASRTVTAVAAAAASPRCFHCCWWRSCQPVKWREALHEKHCL